MCSCSLWSSENFQEDFALAMIKSGQKQREIKAENRSDSIRPFIYFKTDR